MKRFNYVQISLKRQVIHNMYSKPTLKHLKPYAQGKQTDEIKTAYNLERVVKLSSNENPYGYSEKVKQFFASRSEEHTSELQSRGHLVCRLLLEKKKKQNKKR